MFQVPTTTTTSENGKIMSKSFSTSTPLRNKTKFPTATCNTTTGGTTLLLLTMAETSNGNQCPLFFRTVFCKYFVMTFNFLFLYTQGRTTTTIWLEEKITSRLYLTLRLMLNKWVYPTSTFSMTPGGTTVPQSSVMEDVLSGKQCPQYSQTEWRKFNKKVT